MRRGTPTLTSLSRSLAMLEAVIADGGARSVAALARELGVPAATAHRQIHSLVEQGYLARHGGGGHVAGPRLLALLGQLDEKQVIANAAAPVLHQLAADLGCVVQLGTLDGDMVTYRIKTGQGAGNLFTRVGMQHEAYCSGIGKVLLAHLPEDQQQTYLAGGPFPALTARTITDARALAAELHKVSEQGHAIDDGEVADGLICVAVPVHQPDGRVLAAVSISQSGAAVHPPAVLMPRLQAVAAEIERAAFGRTFR
ncbi:IclR family transcriptional regulator [Novosphingobium sp.]|uniref:IclR family transcriptional regulator n=1 Tax=Novosphingobium sp. TaxID=1874826 RepID=UPI00273741F8|nr:IclR family transcriptional regulator [Novosphingobium sp.]MDP3908517.1 IclR family transcriptional regulator [Novosphingobium sp.]